MSKSDQTAETEKLRVYVRRVEEEISKLEIYTRPRNLYPFDTVAQALISKALSIASAGLTLIDAGFAQEAFGLSRSLVECALTLRFITQDRNRLPERTNRYIDFKKSDRHFWTHYALLNAAGTPREQEIRNHADQRGWADATVRNHWSGKSGFAWKTNLDVHPLDEDIRTELAKKTSYAFSYHETSSFVHCYVPAVESFFPPELLPFKANFLRHSDEKRVYKSLLIIVWHVHTCVAYALYGLNFQRPDIFNSLFEDTLKSLSVPRLAT